MSGSGLDLELRRAQLQSQLALLKLRAAAIRLWLQRRDIVAPLQTPSSSLVTAVDTAMFQVTLLAAGPDVLPEAVGRGDLPPVAEQENTTKVSSYPRVGNELQSPAALQSIPRLRLSGQG